MSDGARAEAEPRAAFEACGRAYVAFALDHPAYFRVMFRPELTGSSSRAAIDVAAARSFGVLLGVVERCQAAGICNGLDAEAVALTGWATAHGVAALSLDGPLGAKGDPRVLAAAVSRTLGSLLASGPTRPASAKAGAMKAGAPKAGAMKAGAPKAGAPKRSR